MNVSEVAIRFSNGEKNLAYGLDTAMKAIRPNAKFDLELNEGKITWHRWDDPDGKSPPTFDQIQKEIDRQEAVSKYYQYAFDRCNHYPDGFQQLDMIWHAIDKGLDLKESEWYKKIKEVKEKYPKPEGDPPPEFVPED